MGQTFHLFNFQVSQARNVLEELFDSMPRVGQRIHVFPKNFNRNIRTYPGHHFVETHLDGLGEFKGHARNFVYFFFNFADQLIFGFSFGPFLNGFEQDDVVGSFDGHRVGGDFGATNFGNDLFYFIREVFQDNVLRQAVAFQSLVQGGAWAQKAVHHDVAFIQSRNEFTPHARKQQQGEYQ